ncbi:YsnF/AvaK domain-containing protein [Lewinella sp. IMCC34183]|uniref:YsnF/AvaK domain-containing protein n=1 Tax=Lewinella sp. IMCC34183 TaxID=2248762 RepID=UPI000E243981|nr:YsnF/AvaK domain-containing protein [Lewinella sp. IMCC34183]
MNNQTVIGVFDTISQANSAKRALENQGFKSDSVDVSKYGSHGERHNDDDNAIGRFFENMFGNDDKDYEHRRKVGTEVASRGTVVTVHTDGMEQARQAATILDNYGSIDMKDRYEKYQSDSFDADTNRTQLNERFDGDIDQDDTLEVIKENVAIGKREVQTGGITVRSHIIERPVEETLRLRTEHVSVTRNPVDRPATGADMRDRTISVKETAEEAVVSKEARVVEEINVRKDVDSRQETVRETARETEIDIEKGTDQRSRTSGERNDRR